MKINRFLVTLITIYIFLALKLACTKLETKSCHPQVSLTIKNSDTIDYIVKFEDLHTEASPNTRIVFKDSALNVNKNDQIVTVIDYYWNERDDCDFYMGKDNIFYKQTYWVKIQIYNELNIINEFDYFPWDTSTVYTFDGDCIHKMYDTLIIP